MSKECVICHQSGPEDDFVELTEKGLKSLIHAAESRGESDKSVHFNLKSPIQKRCRKNYVSKEKILRWNAKQENVSIKAVKRTRSSELQCNLLNCLFCDCEVKNVDTPDICVVQNESLRSSLLNICEGRKDEWAMEVKCRLQSIMDLVSSGAIYHRECSSNFRNGKSKPSWRFSKLGDDAIQNKPKKGRPSDHHRLACFHEVTKLLEENNRDATFTISFLCDQMKQIYDCDPYDKTYMKKKLIAKYGEDLVISSTSGKDDIVTLTRCAKKILSDFHTAPKRGNTKEEKLRIIEAAAEFIQNDIKRIPQRLDEYNFLENIESNANTLEFIPVSLQVYLNRIILSKSSINKIAPIGQAMIQASRPRTILAPLQVSVCDEKVVNR